MKKMYVFFICLTFLMLSINAAGKSEGNYKKIVLDSSSNGMTVDLPEDAMIILKLETHPSSGYQWQLINHSKSKSVVKELKWSKHGAKHPEFEEQERIIPGAPQTQLLRLVGEKKGKVKVTFAYCRPWQGGHKKLHKLTIKSKGKFKGTGTSSRVSQPKAYVPPPPEEVYVASLPSHFDWRDQGGVTPVKDQLSCGSCWAFGSIAAFEAKIKIKDGVERDLSEQYAVSCNDEGMSCAGGWWFHDYHWFKCIPSEAGAGARYEADFPYVGSDVPCNPPHTPHEQLEGWAYTDDVEDDAWPNFGHYVTTAELKQKIYDYGPVPTSLCSSTWGSYTGGVFTNHCSSANHIVLITGWDDNDGCFYIKNSWGTGWGENGYMRLAYNTCEVGYCSTYLFYEKTNPRILYRSSIFHEDKANDGSINNSIELKIEDSTASTQFSVTSGYFTQGTHYTVSNLPSNLSMSIQALSSTEAEVFLSGSASDHLDAHDVNDLTISFTNAAFTGNDASAVENSTFSELKLNFFDPYQLIYFDVDDVTISSSNVWQFYWLEGSDYSYGFGLWWYDSQYEPPENTNCLKLETYTKPALSHGTALPPNLKALNYGDEIGPNSTVWAAGGSYGEQHTLAGPVYDDWKGKTRYVGFTSNYNGYPVYGWMRFQVNSNGTAGTLLDYAWEQDPNKSILAGYTQSTTSPPTAAFSADPTSLLEGGTVDFTDQSTYGPTSWAWTFEGGNPSTSTEQDPTVTYNTMGAYDVTLTVTNAYGNDTETKYNYVTVNALQAPVANFSADDTSVEEGSTVNFTDLSTNSPTSWSWSFEGGTPSTSTQQNPSITYNTEGTYQVSLTATNAAGSDTETKNNYITVNAVQAPVANFSADDSSVEEGSTVNFTDLSTNSPTSWSWSFAGGTPSGSTQQNPSITYNTVGTYNVSLTATNAGGSDTETKTSYITVSESIPEPYCEVGFGNPPGQYFVNVTVGSIDNDSTYISGGYENFTSLSTNMERGVGYQFTATPHASWSVSEFGLWIDWNQDGDFNDSGETIYTYYGQGPWTTTITPPASAKAGSTRLRIVAECYEDLSPCGTEGYHGEAEDYTIQVISEQPPVADFSADNTTVDEGQTVNFTDLSTNAPTSWSWSFAGGTPSTSTQQNPTVTYNAEGTYQVSLTATNEIGSDTETKTNYITVNALQPPVADFSADNTTVDEGQTVNFTDLSTNSPTSWSWTFAGGTPSTSTQQNPSIIYNTAGTYQVSLTAANAAGSDSETKTGYITVSEAPPCQYCDKSFYGSAGQYIVNVNVGSIDNDSTYNSSTYEDFTSLSTSMARGTGYSITVTPYASWAGSKCGIRIDWNRDCDFDDANETIYTFSGRGPWSTTITPPTNAQLGSTRMRVVTIYGGALSTCDYDNNYGETEDYTIDVTN